jgi:hypothetical protein
MGESEAPPVASDGFFSPMSTPPDNGLDLDQSYLSSATRRGPMPFGVASSSDTGITRNLHDQSNRFEFKSFTDWLSYSKLF